MKKSLLILFTMLISLTTSAQTAENIYWKGVEYDNAGDYTTAIRFFQQAAEQGYPYAQYSLGRYYEYGLGTTQDYEHAIYWYTKGIENYNKNAYLGLLSVNNKLNKHNPISNKYSKYSAEDLYKKAKKQEQKAYKYCELIKEEEQKYGKEFIKYLEMLLVAAEKGLHSAQFDLGKIYYKTVKYYDQAGYWLQNVTIDWIPTYWIYDIANAYYTGKGATQNYTEAVKWYRKLAEQGDAYAQYNLGLCYENGTGVIQNYTEAIEWFQKAADRGNSNAKQKANELQQLIAQTTEQPQNTDINNTPSSTQSSTLDELFYNGGIHLLSKGDKGGAFESFLLAANLGNLEAQFMLATMDIDKKWYQKAAEEGYAYAQYLLGKHYYSGIEVNQNYTEAVKWFRKAAEQGYIDAQRKLGFCYSQGEGVNKSYREAAKWYRKAAEQGDAYAQYIIGDLYYHGKGVNKSYNEAVKWLQKAAEQGNENAKVMLNHIKSSK